MYGVGQSTSTIFAPGRDQVLSRADLLAFDPAAPMRPGENRVCCPLCGGDKRLDAAHRSLVWNAGTGAYQCHRCKIHGLLLEYRTKPGERTLPNHGKSQSRNKLYALSVNAHASPVEAPYTRRGNKPTPEPNPLTAQRTVELRSPTPANVEWRTALVGRLPLAGSPGERYLSGRGLPDLFCQAQDVCYHSSFFGRPAVVFALRDGDGCPVAAQGRYIDGRDTPRMRTVGEKKRGVFAALDPVTDERGGSGECPVVITEAPIDALSLAYCGLPALALCGTGALPAPFVRRFAFRTVYAAFDADTAGDDAALALARQLAPVGAMVRRLRPTNGTKDWNDLLQTDADALCQLCMTLRRVQ